MARNKVFKTTLGGTGVATSSVKPKVATKCHTEM